MENGLVESAARVDEPEDRRIYGVTVAQVVNNCDETRSGRVQVRLPWLPGFEPWVRLALLDRGVFFVPQVGDEVLVTANRGDISELYIVGCLWNGKDQPPAQEHDAPVNKRIIRTPLGHDVTFDDQAATVSITSADKKHITLSKDHIELAIDENASTVITIEKNGNVTIKAQTSITLDAPTINVTASQNLALGGNQSARIDGGSYCSIDAGLIKIG